MFDQFVSRPRVLARHREGPAVEARERFLQHCADQGMAYNTLRHLANEVLIISQRLDIAGHNKFTHKQISTAAERWARHQRRRGRSTGLRCSRDRFLQVATQWLKFLERLQIDPIPPPAYMHLIEPFVLYMREERGLSVRTIGTRQWHIEKFLNAFGAERRPLCEVAITDVDAFLASLGAKACLLSGQPHRIFH